MAWAEIQCSWHQHRLPMPYYDLVGLAELTSMMCSLTQSYMPSQQSLQMLDFSGMNLPVWQAADRAKLSEVC